MLLKHTRIRLVFRGGSGSTQSACNAGDPGLIPGSGISPTEGNGNLCQYSRLENSMDRGAWQDCKESDMTEHAESRIAK